METNNYPSWLVSVEIAKKLKEIGFDLPCTFVLTNMNHIGFTTKEDSNYHLFDDLDLHSNSEDSLLCVPTFEQVLDWFRDRGFRISLENHDDSTKFMFYNMKINEGRHFKGEFSSYEKTREELITKLIEVYENSI